MANLLAEEMFIEYNSSLLREHTVNQTFFMLYRVQVSPTNLSFNLHLS